MMKQVLSEFPDLDLLVHNASVFDESPLASVDEEVFDRQFDVNFKSPFFMTQQYINHCTSGHVVNILIPKSSPTVPGVSPPTIFPRKL